jgi:hypothetical protein
VRAALGTRRDPLTGRWVRAVPTETTIRRTLARVDPEALAAAIGAWLADRDQPDQRRRAVAVDGKTLRGARRAADGRQAHLLAAMDHATRVVLAQRRVDGAPGEVTAFQPLLAGLELVGAMVTADVLHTHAAAAEFPVTSKQAHYLLAVKANQPSLLDRCVGLPWPDVSVLDRTRDRAHGRVELRTLKAVTIRGSPSRTPAGRPGHPQDLRPWQAAADRGRLRGHQPHLRPGQPHPARRPHPGALGDRERPALRPGRDLRRGRLPGCAPGPARRSWPACAT